MTKETGELNLNYLELVLYHLFISKVTSFMTSLRFVLLELATIIFVSSAIKTILASLAALLGKLLI